MAIHSEYMLGTNVFTKYNLKKGEKYGKTNRTGAGFGRS